MIDPVNLFFFVGGIAVTLWVGVRFSERRTICYESNQRSMFSIDKIDEADNFEITYRGQKVSYVNSHRLYIWNSGNKALWESNFSVENPLTFEFEEGSILKLDQIEFVSEGLQWTPIVDENRFIPNFEVLDSGTGVAVSILETRETPRPTVRSRAPWDFGPKVVGTVIDLKHPPRRKTIPDPSDGAARLTILAGILLAIALLMIGFGLFGHAETLRVLRAENSTLTATIGGVLLGSFVQVIWRMVRDRQLNVPNELRELESTRRLKESPVMKATREVAESFERNEK